MKSEYVNPFVEATVETYDTMVGVRPQRDGKLCRKAGIFAAYDLVGVLGLSGKVCGAVIMTTSVETGMKVVSSFLGEEVEATSPDLLDGFGELLNIVAGSAAAKLNGLNIKLALPTVIMGKEQRLTGKENSPWIVIPMAFPEWGKFNIEISMEEK